MSEKLYALAAEYAKLSKEHDRLSTIAQDASDAALQAWVAMQSVNSAYDAETRNIVTAAFVDAGFQLETLR